MQLKIIIRPGEDKGYVAQVPALPGCWSQGDTPEEASANAIEAIQGWLEVQQDKFESSIEEESVEIVTV